MVATGHPFEDGKKTEILDLEDSNFQCDGPEFPVGVLAASGAVVNGQPMICGGVVKDSGRTKSCFTLKDQTWEETQTVMTSARNYMGPGIVLDNKLVLTGGKLKSEVEEPEDSDFVTTIELVDGRTSELNHPGDDGGLHGHCQIAWNSTTIFTIGGGESFSSYSADTWFINLDKKVSYKGPKMKNARAYFGCGEMVVDGNTYIVAAGGWNGKEVIKSTEILNKDDLTSGWTDGNNI